MTPVCGNIAAVQALLRDLGIGVCKQTIMNWSDSGKLPRPVRLARNKLVWNLDAVRAAVLRLLEGGASNG
jgi:hypothetical protein